MFNAFKKFAVSGMGISSTTLDSYTDILGTYVNPMVTEERKLNVAQMDVFSRLMMDRIIFIGCPIDDEVSNIVTAQLLFLNNKNPRKDISLWINSPGGVVSSGLAIYDTMQLIDADVVTTCRGKAASMAAVLLAGGAKGKRRSLPNSRVMIHQPLGGTRGQAADMRIDMEEMNKTEATLYRILSTHIGRPYDEIKAACDRNRWFSADEALEYGIIDTVLTKMAPDTSTKE